MSTESTLKFRQDGSFTIVQFTDLHFGDGMDGADEVNGKTAALMQRVIDAEQPDLIVLTGDMIWANGVEDPKAAYRKAISTVANGSIPWTAVLGNHDVEGTAAKEELMQIQQESLSCLSESGPEHINGVGNFVLTVKDAAGAEDCAAFFLFVSGDHAPEAIGGYSYIHTDQVGWYDEQSRLLTEAAGKVLPSLAFLHIPFPEYEQAWGDEAVVGVKNEMVCCPRINTGLFAAMVQRGDVVGTFVGHDHDNDYSGTVHGIRLSYGRVTGYNCYGGLTRGARVIKLQEGSREFDSYIVEDK